jgi:hypothetical protein
VPADISVWDQPASQIDLSAETAMVTVVALLKFIDLVCVPIPTSGVIPVRAKIELAALEDGINEELIQ